MLQRFLRNSTAKVADIMQRAIAEVASMRKNLITPEVILISLLEQRDSITLKIFDELRIDTLTMRQKLTEHLIDSISLIPEPQPPKIPIAMKIAQETNMLFEQADKERQKLNDSYIATGTLFLAFFHDSLKTKQVLNLFNLTYESCLEAYKNIRGNTLVVDKDAESRVSLLDEYTIDLTALARKSLLDPVISRQDEIKRVIEILSRRKKNNPIIIGEPGTGKTVIAEGLAQQIVNGDVPDFLLQRKVCSLEIGSLIAGAKMQGEFEERLKAIRDEVIAASGDIILFIDEIHTVIGAGRSAGALDASNMLKPALAKGILQCIGSTTLKEYKKYIETDKALERRFQVIHLQEPSEEEAIMMLRGLQEKYENHHQIEYSEDSIKKAVTLSRRYIHDRFLPDKAIDLMDEAGATKRLEVVYTPPEIKKLELTRQDHENKKLIAFNEQDFEAMSQHQVMIANIEVELKAAREKHKKRISRKERKVTGSDIAKIVSKMTLIPLEKMSEDSEAIKLKSLEENIAKRIISQKHVISTIANAIRRNHSGLRKPDTPIASFLFLGPTGVGKTEMVKAIAEQLMDDESKIIRLDMSEYMEKHSVSKLIGSPPGYIGYGEGGQLTEKVKHNPYSIILLDEFEKAHQDVYNILLPILDEGWLTDAEGQRVSFRNCLIIGTSNLGSQILVDEKKPLGLGTSDETITQEEKHQALLKEVKKFLRPEFINRLDEIVVFDKLNKIDLEKILNLHIEDLKERLSSLNLGLKITKRACSLITSQTDSFHYGARPLKRKIDLLIENKIASLLIGHKKKENELIMISSKGDDIIVSLKS